MIKGINKILKTQSGFTLVELAVSLIILGIFVVAGYKGMDIIMRDIKNAETFDAKTTLAANLLNTLVTDSKSVQVEYTSQSGIEFLNDPEDFKNAWDLDGRIGKLEDCQGCKGRFGYVIEPIFGNKQINILTLKIYHPSFQGQKTKSYTRVIGTR